MPHNRRSYNRFDVHIVGEFKSLAQPALSFLGITRDFSFGGISFESHFSDLCPGDNLELKFKDPAHDLVVSTHGEIVWKRNTEKFICLMGIKFRDISDVFKSRMLKIISAAGNVPVNFLLSGADTANEKIRAAETEEGNDDHTVYAKTVRGNNTGMSIVIAAASAAVLFFSLPAQLENPINGVTTPHTDSIELRSYQGNEKNSPVSVTDNDPLNRPAEKTSHKPSQETGMAVPDSTQTEQRGLSHRDNAATVNSSFIIQVGSWKNPDYAREALDNLMEYYPDTYLVAEKGFHVIRIPGIMTKTDGEQIIKEIEDTYNLIPLLVFIKK